MRSEKIRILFVFGTRPEALKLAPLILNTYSKSRFQPFVCLTAQHREMVDQVLEIFRIKTDFDLNLMEKGQTLSALTQKIFPKMDAVLRKAAPDVVLVQGDTTTALIVALKAFYEKIPVAHVEAGLRSFDKYNPFPEEINRRLLSHLADFHFAPTQAARENLLREGMDPGRIWVTGNTVVDALKQVRAELKDTKSLSEHQTKRYQVPAVPGTVGTWYLSAGIKSAAKKKIILVTAHRRESFGAPLVSICRALKDIVSACPDAEIIFPVHLNPNVQRTVRAELGRVRGIHLATPLSYKDFLGVMSRCYLILTDSGGVQEEAPSFRKPVLVMRNVSERMEGVRLGIAKIVGTSRKKIAHEALLLLTNRKAYQKMIKNKNPYGDGRASERILKALEKSLKDVRHGN